MKAGVGVRPNRPSAVGGAECRPAAARVSAWLAIDKRGNVTLYAGKVELGTGVQTALAQLVAEELDVPLTRVSVSPSWTCWATRTCAGSAYQIWNVCVPDRVMLP